MAECDFNITIVGLGLIGASYAAALKKLNFKNIWGIDTDKETLKKAEGSGIIDKGFFSPEEPLRNSDIVIIALYPSSTISFVKNNINFFKSGAIITDSAGLKKEIVRKISEFLPETLDFIGGHPMAGREGKGIDNATSDIFKGANYIITPIEKNKRENIEFLSNVAYKIGCSKVIEIEAEVHDSFIAFTSQLPHVLAAAIMNSNENTLLSSFVGNGFKDSTRIAINNSSLWSELILENKDNLIHTINMFQKEVEGIKKAIIDNDESFIKGKFEEANQKRREII